MSVYDKFSEQFRVSRETIDRLVWYVNELQHWNQAYNLVRADDLGALWARHILDCAQLSNYLPRATRIILDLGSGAGLPGIVLSILTNIPVILFESKHKKSVFLQHIANQLDLKISVITGEAHVKLAEQDWGSNIVVASRALGSLLEILTMIKNVSRETNFSCLLLKSRKQLPLEFNEARKKWVFNHEIYTSITSPTGCVLKISDIREKS